MTTRAWVQKAAGSNHPPRRRLIRRLTLACLALLALGGLLVPSGPAAAQPAPGRGRVLVVQASGLLDPVMVDFLTDALDRAERERVVAMVVQLDAPGSVVGTSTVDVLAFRIAHAEVPVAVWVGPTGARAYEGGAQLVLAAAVAGMAPGTRIGRAEPALGDRRLVGRTVARGEAVEEGLVDLDAPTLGDFIVGLDGRRVGGRTLDTAEVERTEDGPRRQPNVTVTFSNLGLLPQLLHTVASPPVAYLLLLVGLVLIVFEFFTAGIGVAGATGAACFVLSAYGLAVLPTRPAGLALVALGVLGFSIDVQAGVPRAWTVIGAAALVLGSLNLFAGLSPGWLPLATGLIGTPLLMLAGMPAMIRSRFSTPTIGRESMVGELGTAVAALSPDGVVRVRGGLWRARTNRATPIGGGDRVRVVAVDGLLLEVEPEHGGARDAGH